MAVNSKFAWKLQVCIQIETFFRHNSLNFTINIKTFQTHYFANFEFQHHRWHFDSAKRVDVELGKLDLKMSSSLFFVGAEYDEELSQLKNQEKPRKASEG